MLLSTIKICRCTGHGKSPVRKSDVEIEYFLTLDTLHTGRLKGWCVRCGRIRKQLSPYESVKQNMKHRTFLYKLQIPTGHTHWCVRGLLFDTGQQTPDSPVHRRVVHTHFLSCKSARVTQLISFLKRKFQQL